VGPFEFPNPLSHLTKGERVRIGDNAPMEFSRSLRWVADKAGGAAISWFINNPGTAAAVLATTFAACFSRFAAAFTSWKTQTFWTQFAVALTCIYGIATVTLFIRWLWMRNTQQQHGYQWGSPLHYKVTYLFASLTILMIWSGPHPRMRGRIDNVNYSIRSPSEQSCPGEVLVTVQAIIDNLDEPTVVNNYHMVIATVEGIKLEGRQHVIFGDGVVARNDPESGGDGKFYTLRPQQLLSVITMSPLAKGSEANGYLIFEVCGTSLIDLNRLSTKTSVTFQDISDRQYSMDSTGVIYRRQTPF
jgi:hypothetical protein